MGMRASVWLPCEEAIESIYLDLLLSLGFVEQARLTHMRQGEPRIDGSRERLLAQTSYAAG